MKHLLIIFSLIFVTNFAISKSPKNDFIVNIDKGISIKYSCKTQDKENLYCEFDKISILKKDVPTKEEIIKKTEQAFDDIPENEKQEILNTSFCEKVDELIKFMKGYKVNKDLIDEGTIKSFSTYKERHKKDFEKQFKHFKKMCTKQKITKKDYIQFLLISGDNERRTCNIRQNKRTTSFKKQGDNLWTEYTEISDICGVYGINSFERLDNDEFIYSEKKMFKREKKDYENERDEKYCKIVRVNEEIKYTPDDIIFTFASDCDYIKFGY